MLPIKPHRRSAIATAAALLWLSALVAPAGVEADFAPAVMVVRGSGISAAVEQDAAGALTGFAEVSDNTAYVNGARDFGLDPTEPQALAELAPGQHVALVVVLERTGRGLHVSFCDGRTGQVLHAIDVGRAKKRLSADQQAQIAEGAQIALSGGPSPAPPPPAAEFPAVTDGSDLPPPEEGVTDLPLPPMDEEPVGPSLAAELAVGPGIGMREIDTPSNGGPRSLSTGLFPAFDIAVRVSTPPRGHFHFGVSGRYRSSVFLTGNETPSGGVPRQTTMRSHHLEIGLMPGYRFTESAQSTVVALFVGWDARAIGLVDQLSIPAYTLHGPCFRPEFLIPLGELFQLRIAPEVIVVASISQEMRDLGALTGTGLGLGGEVGLSLRLSKSFSAAFTYRESHISASSEWLVSFTDVERFVSMQGVLQY